MSKELPADYRCNKCGRKLIYTKIGSNALTDAYVCENGHQFKFPTGIHTTLKWGAIGFVMLIGVASAGKK